MNGANDCVVVRHSVCRGPFLLLEEHISVMG